MWHGIVVSMMDCGPEDPGSIPRLAKMWSFFLVCAWSNLIGELVSMKIQIELWLFKWYGVLNPYIVANDHNWIGVRKSALNRVKVLIG